MFILRDSCADAEQLKINLYIIFCNLPTADLNNGQRDGRSGVYATYIKRSIIIYSFPTGVCPSVRSKVELENKRVRVYKIEKIRSLLNTMKSIGEKNTL